MTGRSSSIFYRAAYTFSKDCIYAAL